MTPAQSKAARAMLGLSRAELAVDAKVGFPSLSLFETGHTAAPDILEALQKALEERGALFHTEDGVEWVGIRAQPTTLTPNNDAE